MLQDGSRRAQRWDVFAAWRHVYEGHIRDIALASSSDRGRTFAPPVRVSEDRWHLRFAFSDVMATSVESVLLTGEFAPEGFTGVLLSGNAFQFLGVPPVIGGTISPSDITPSGEPDPVVVLSCHLWQRLFQGDARAIGKTMRLNDRPYRDRCHATAVRVLWQ